MKKITIAASAIGLGLIGIAWLAEAKLSTAVAPPHLIYNPQARVYQLQDTTPYADQTLEQKLLTIRSINRQEGQLETQATPAAQ